VRNFTLGEGDCQARHSFCSGNALSCNKAGRARQKCGLRQ